MTKLKNLEKILSDHFGGQADILIHADPCTDPECPICGHEPCDDRREPHKLQRLWISENLTCSGTREEHQPSVPQAR